MVVDSVDRKIIRALQENARHSYREIGEKVGIRAPSVHARVKRLEDEGIITGYRAEVDASKVGRAMTAIVSIGLEGGRKGAIPRAEAIANALRRDGDVVEVHTVAGEDDLLVKVRVADMAGLERLLLRTLEPLEGVRRTTTTIVVRTMFERVPPV